MTSIKSALTELQPYLSYVEELNEGDTLTFRLSYGRLKIWRVTDNMFWVGLILRYKHDPTLDNILPLISKLDLYTLINR